MPRALTPPRTATSGRSASAGTLGSRSVLAAPDLRLRGMSGHSKWSTIKHKKAATDARKGAIFTKMAREIAVAAKEGGGDATSNFRLRLAVQKAREVNMPMDNIDRAIKRGSGEQGGVQYEELRYEGYGPGGVAIMVDALTDNSNRTASEIRSIFTRHGGAVAEQGSVGWIFKRQGVIIAGPAGKAPEELALEGSARGARAACLGEGPGRPRAPGGEDPVGRADHDPEPDRARERRRGGGQAAALDGGPRGLRRCPAGLRQLRHRFGEARTAYSGRLASGSRPGDERLGQGVDLDPA